MPKMPIVFGHGLGRETGVMAMRPGGMDDLRNVHPMRGKFQVRRGFERVLTFTDPSGNPQTDILGGIAVLGQRDAIYVTYDSVNALVNLWSGDAEANWASHFGTWEFKTEGGTNLLQPGSDPPVIMLAEYDGTVLLAHTHNDVALRAQTWALTKSSHVWSGQGLTVNWGTTQKVRFRGVVKHLEYMVGWGWGDASEDRPELVRISEPGTATSFDELDYWVVGDQGDPVVACYPAVESLIAFKETQSWELFGNCHLNFGQRLLDNLYGMLEPRLAVSIEGAVFSWTNEGPRAYSGAGTSVALEPPLDLTLPEPYDLVAEGESKYAFAVYMPVYRSIWFVFGKRVYSIYIPQGGVAEWDSPRRWPWGYQELGFTPLCGFRLPQAGWGLVTPPTGYPSNPTASNITDTTADITVTNNGQDGDETLELWLKPGGGSGWSLYGSYAVGTDPTKVINLTGLQGGWYYDLAVRYRRGPHYTAGYENDDPLLWPASSRTNFTTTLAALPTIDSLVWARASASVEQILVTVTPPYSGNGYDVQLRRGGADIYTFQDISGTEGYYDPGITGEVDNVYDCRLVTPYVTGAYTATKTCWGGPLSPSVTSLTQYDANGYEIHWAAGGDYSTEVWDDFPTPTGDFPQTLRKTVGPTLNLYQEEGEAGWSGETAEVGVRHISTVDGVDDYSEFDSDTVVI